MHRPKNLQNILIGTTALFCVGGAFVPHQSSGPVLSSAVALVSAKPASGIAATAASAAASAANVVASARKSMSPLSEEASVALSTLSSMVQPLSSPKALEDAFHSYFAFKAAHPDQVKKPYLYFVDYGLPSTAKRGYVFDMSALKIVDGPFTVAHGRGSSTGQYGIPTKFSNASKSAASSLGLFVTRSLYAFTGHTGGQAYHSVGMRLDGVSGSFNDNAFARGVVAHGAPYVTPTKAGRSEGCPAMEESRAERLLPKLADGAMVFLFAPNSSWLSQDPWVTANAG